MPVADEQDVRDILPHQVENLPTKDDIDVVLAAAEAKTAQYPDVTDTAIIKKAQANWACYRLLKTKVQLPQREQDGPIENELAEDPAADYKRAFNNLMTAPGPELI